MSNIIKNIIKLKDEVVENISKIKEEQQLNNEKAKYLGKKGIIAEAIRMMDTLDESGKKELGRVSNETKKLINVCLENQRKLIENEKINQKLLKEAIDVTLPGTKIKTGTRHVLRQTVDEIVQLFSEMGYIVAEGPEIENEDYNFEKLNLPKNHPARDMQDTFYITEQILLRTHTSPVQVRTMLKNNGNKPIKIVCPGKVYRRDDDDATHSHQFMQLEGLIVDKKVSISDLKGTLDEIARKMFGEDKKIRLRPSYFPFTEPSVEVDVTCNCGGVGCNICKQTGWIEILGAGMVHPNVLTACGYDPEVYRGFAFGLGIERIAMLKYGIDDIRNFYINDIRFLNQFN